MTAKTWMTLAALGAGLLGSTAGAAQQPEQGALKAAEAADTAWLHLVDAGQYKAAWKAQDPDAQKVVAERDFVRAMEGARDPFGAVKSREPIESTLTHRLPGAPDGTYVVTGYRTDFADKPGAVETLSAKQELDGTWKVDGYHIR